MKYLILMFCLSMAACGKAQDSGSGSAFGVAEAAASGGGGGSGGSSSSLQDQFLIACPTNMSAAPEILKRFGTNILLVSGTGSSLSYTLLSVGNHNSGDGRGCNFDVNSDGSITSN